MTPKTIDGSLSGQPSPAQPTAGFEPDQLAGFSIVLTSDRRAEEFAAAFTRRGATVLQAPILRIIPLEQDAELIRATGEVIAHPPDDVIVTTAIGFRGWIEAADAVGLAPALLEVLGRARLLARGPKARGAIRAAGLVEAWAATSETTAEVVDRLLAEPGGVAGRRVVVQLHGLPDEGLLARLPAAGADLARVPVYRWGPPPDPAAVQRAIDAVCARTVDAVLFTSAPGSQAFLDAALAAGRQPELLEALAGDVVPAAVGPVTAAPLVAAGLSPLVPDRFRLGALVRAVADHLAQERVREVRTAAGVLHLRGQAATLDGRPLTLSPAPMAILRALALRPGEVVDRRRLLAALPGAADLHAVEVAVARLRSGLGRVGIVETVVKRGYRLTAA
ncbi:MAG TPA: uroporphyrinogen-III synthase [Kineosporiaceae bacterium]